MEVIDIERQIRIQYADQCHVFKIQSLGDHLGAEKNGNVFLFKLLQKRFVPVRCADGVGVHTQDFGVREQRL